MAKVSDDLSYSLPTEAVHRGWYLRYIEPILVDPVQLVDRTGKVLYEWEYTPSLTEVFEVCKEIKDSQGGR